VRRNAACHKRHDGRRGAAVQAAPVRLLLLLCLLPLLLDLRSGLPIARTTRRRCCQRGARLRRGGHRRLRLQRRQRPSIEQPPEAGGKFGGGHVSGCVDARQRLRDGQRADTQVVAQRLHHVQLQRVELLQRHPANLRLAMKTQLSVAWLDL